MTKLRLIRGEYDSLCCPLTAEEQYLVRLIEEENHD